MLEKFRNRLLVSLGVLFAPMATIATAEDAANYEQLKEAVDGSAAQINITDNIDFGEDGTTLDVAATTTVSGAARVITSNTNEQTPIFNVSAGNSLTITGLTLRQAVREGDEALITSAGNLYLSDINLQDCEQSIIMTGNGSITFNGDTNSSIFSSIVTEINNSITNNSSGTLTLGGDMSTVRGSYTQTAGITEFTEDSIFFSNTTNLSNSTLKLGQNVNITNNSIVNLNGNATVEAKNGNTIAETEINAENAANTINGSYIINGTADTATKVTVGNEEGKPASLTLVTSGADSSIVVGPNTNIKVLSNGNLILNATDGNITVERSANALNLAANSKLELNGTQAINFNNSIVSDANSNIVKSGAGKLNINADMSGVKGTYSQTAGTTEFANNSTYFNGTSNLSNSTLTLGQNVDITNNSVVNLNGNAIVEVNNGNKISASAITATNARNVIRGSEYTINGVAPTETAEAKYTTVTVGNAAGADSSLAFAATAKEDGTKGNVVVGPYTNINVLSNGNLIFDAAGGDITLEKSNNAVSLANNAAVTLAGSKTINLGNSIKTAEGATGNITVIGDATSTANINADMSGANVKYTQNAGTVNVNNAFFAAAADSVAGKDAILNFNNGSSISTDNLTVNEGFVTFNENEVTAITDAKFSKNSGYITYGDNKISLKESAVTLNNGYVLSTANADTESQQIEIVKGNNGVHSLTLKNASIDEDTDLNLSNGASLTFDNGSSAKEFSTITIDNSSTVNLSNTADSTITIGSDFIGTGTINKSQAGNVVLSGDSSDFTGIYNQAAGRTEFADNSNYFQGTSNINNSTLALGKNVNIESANIINLTGNGIIEANNENQIAASVINATNAGNTIKGFNYSINGTAPSEEAEAQYTTINIGNAEGLNSSLAISATSKNEAVLNEDGTPVLDEEGNQVYKVINGKVSVGPYTDINVNKNGELKLDAAGGDIIVDNSDKAISFDNNSTLTFAGKEIITVDREISTLEDNIANVVINEAPIVNLNADMSKAKVKYNQSNGTVNVNNKFFNTQEGTSITNNGHLHLNQGAQLVSDIAVTNNGSVAFNQNDVSSIEEAVFARENGHVTYGTNKISLSQANVTLNNEYVLSAANADKETSKIEIGQTANQGIKSLTIQEATIGSNADINLENGKLTLKDGAKALQGSVITLDQNSVVDFKNNEKTVVVDSKISGNGTISKVNTETEQNLGLVQLTGDNSGFIGKYIQNAGTVEFTSGSTFFGNGFSTQITGGELKLADGVKVTNTENVVIPVINSSLTTEIKDTNADLHAKQVTVGENQAVTFKLENSGLALNKNANVTTSSNNLVIGNDGSNTLITNLTLGNSAYNPEETVNLNISGDNTVTLVNVNAQNNVGVLTIGDNINVIANPEAPLALTTNLGDNTAVVLKVSENSPINNKEIALNLNANQAADIANNAKLVKAASGKLLLGGNNSNFNGTVQVDNGTISVQPDSLLGQNVKYSLQNAESNANISLAPLHDTTINPNMDIIGINLADNAVATVVNTGVENGTVSVAGATLVDNKSSLKISSADTITLADTKIGSANDASSGNITLTAKNININNNDAVLVKGEGSYLTLNGESNVAKDFILKNATLNLNGNMNIGGNFSAGSTVNMINNQINTQTIAGNMDLTGNTDYKIDINGVLLQSDKVVANGIITAAQPTTLDISKIHFITEPKYDNTLFHVFNDANTNAGQEIDPNVVFTASTGFVDAPVGKYIMNSVGNGNYMLSRIGYNPYVLAGPVAAQAGYYTQLNSYNLAFSNADMIMALPKNEREAYKNANKYAEAELPSIAAASNSRYDVDAADKIVIDQSNLIQNQTGGWFRPYGIFENVKLKNGPEVGNNMYGAYVGAESKVKELGHGFDGTLGVYAGYDGSHQTFEGVGVYQNGGTIGLTGALYKNDFFNLTTANIGASGADQDSIYGSADFWMLRAGLANKTGYNWDLADGKFIIQPHLMMSLSSVSLFSYEAAPNIKIDDESLFTYQLAPGFKFIGNTANGWQPYVSIDMIWNIGGHNNNKANGISLPEMYSEPWLEYGLGLQKRYGERFTGYGQAMFRSIGRNGVALTAGMRWRVGEGR